jgi:hypothetical protein
MYAAGMNCATLIYKSVQEAGAPAFGTHMAEKWERKAPHFELGYGVTRTASINTITSRITTRAQYAAA